MFQYSPPKARLWGHQVSRHTATEVLKFCQQFLSDYCILKPPPPFEVKPSRLYLMWNPIDHEQITPLVTEIQGFLGNSVETICDEIEGVPSRMQFWLHQDDQLPAIAAFYDRHVDVYKEHKVSLMASGRWFFTWRDDFSNDPIGGSISCYIGFPLRVGTHFGFRDFKHYETIKQYFLQIGLFEMSEKHLTPKS